MKKFVIGDLVEILSGRYKGETGTITRMLGSVTNLDMSKTYVYGVVINKYCDRTFDFQENDLKKLNKNVGIHEYPTRKIYLFDLLKLMDGHNEIILVDEDVTETMYEGRVEDLTTTADGVAHDLCDRVIRDIDVSSDGKIMLSLLNQAYPTGMNIGG